MDVSHIRLPAVYNLALQLGRSLRVVLDVSGSRLGQRDAKRNGTGPTTRGHL